ASLSEYPSIPEAIAFQLSGLVVVFVALGSIWGLLELMGLFFRRRVEVAKPQPAPVMTKPATQVADSRIPPEILAVIAAAVATVVKQPHRLNVVAAEAPPRDWAREGRREIFGSHKIR